MSNGVNGTSRRDILRLAGGSGLLALGAALSACSGQSGFGGLDSGQAAQQPGESIGSGETKVALLLPMTATGNAGKTAQAMRSAAELALSEMGSQPITLLPYDTAGTPEGARSAAQAALAAGATVCLGPLFSSSVGAAAPAFRSAGVPMIAFSTDTGVSGQGVYLLSFLPQTDIDRIVKYATSQGKRSFAALLPTGAYGTVVEGAARESIARYGGQLRAVEYYEPDSLKMQDPVQRIAAVAGGANPSVDALIVPDGAAGLKALSDAFGVHNIDPRKVTLLGSGQWDDPLVRGLPTFAGGLYAAPDPRGFDAMATRFQSRFGYRPPRLASLSYDGVSLIAALAAQNIGFSQTILTNPDGFDGTDGIFRFNARGTNERGLAIMAVATGAPQIVVPAPRSFSAGF
ncbi:MAG: penicillin-binding protein activator [Rhodobiaceae bacterium]|nr:penicillin-binding protein activator [Rhodobiaceae bacterium]MCC0055401.1 penicillin-binding protein activator [Rhodobiaceae bacterium]